MVGFALSFYLYLLFLQMEQFLLVQTLSNILSWPEVVLPKFFSLSFHQLRSTKIVITMIILHDHHHHCHHHSHYHQNHNDCCHHHYASSHLLPEFLCQTFTSSAVGVVTAIFTKIATVPFHSTVYLQCQ